MNKKICFLLVAFIFICGCNTGGRVSVTGTVKYDDGTPVDIGFVKFVGDTTQATAKIDKNGRFSLSEIKSGDGIKPGTYKIAVTGVKTGGGSDGTPLTRFIDAKYENPSTSGLTCQVEGAMNFDITVIKNVTVTKPRPQRKRTPGRP